jgi:hypothetical protein
VHTVLCQLRVACGLRFAEATMNEQNDLIDDSAAGVIRRYQHQQLRNASESATDDVGRDKSETDSDFRFRRRTSYPGIVVRRHSTAAPSGDECGNNNGDIDDDDEDTDRRSLRRGRPELEDASWETSADETTPISERRRIHLQSVGAGGRSLEHAHEEEMLEQDGGHDDDDDFVDRLDDADEKRPASAAMVGAAAAAAMHAQWPFPFLARPPMAGGMPGNAAGKLLSPYVQFPSMVAPPRESNVKLAAIDGTEVAVAQFAENNILPADMAALNVVLWNLHQQQMFQMHLLLQLQQQIVFATANPTNPGAPGGNGSIGDISETVAAGGSTPIAGTGQVLPGEVPLPAAAQHQFLQQHLHQQPLAALFSSHSVAPRPFGSNSTTKYPDVGSKPGIPDRDESLTPQAQSSMPTSTSGATPSTPSVPHGNSVLAAMQPGAQQPLPSAHPLPNLLPPASQQQPQQLASECTTSVSTTGDYVSGPPSLASGVGGLGAIPPMLAMIDMSLGRLEQQQKQSSEGNFFKISSDGLFICSKFKVLTLDRNDLMLIC